MSFLKIEKKNNVLNIVLNRPEKRNAFNPEFIEEITQTFHKASQSQLRAVVIRAEGESFCAGGDLSWMKSMVNYSFEENKKDAENLFNMFEAISLCPHPTLACVHGHVMGGGLGFVAACDLISAESQTLFGFSEVKLGLVASVINPFVLRKMPSSQARLYMLTGQTFSTQEALNSHLIHFYGSQKEVEVWTEKQLEHFNLNFSKAVSETKKLIQFVEKKYHWNEIKKECVRVISERRISSEAQEALKRFLEKK